MANTNGSGSAPGSGLSVAQLEARVRRLERILNVQEPAPVVAQAAQAKPAAKAVAPVAKARGASLDELQVGTRWFAWLGVALLVVGFVLFANYLFHSFGAAEKALFTYASAAALFGVGLALRRRYASYAQILLGCGWAVAFFMTYALHAVDATRLIENGLAASLLLVLVSLAGTLFARFAGYTIFEHFALGSAFFAVLISGLGEAWTVVPLAIAAATGISFVLSQRSVVTASTTVVGLWLNLVVWVGVASGPQGSLSVLGGAVTLAVAFWLTWGLITWLAGQRNTPLGDSLAASLLFTGTVGAYLALMFALRGHGVDLPDAGTFAANVIAALGFGLASVATRHVVGSWGRSTAVNLGAALAALTLGIFWRLSGVDELLALAGVAIGLIGVSMVWRSRPALIAALFYAVWVGAISLGASWSGVLAGAFHVRLLAAQLLAEAVLVAVWLLGSRWWPSESSARMTVTLSITAAVALAVAVLGREVPASWLALCWLGLALVVFFVGQFDKLAATRHLGSAVAVLVALRLSFPTHATRSSEVLYYLSVAAAVGVLAVLSVGYRRLQAAGAAGRWIRAAELLAIVGVALLVLFCREVVSPSFVTLSWAVVGLGSIAVGFFGRSRATRLAGVGALLLAVLRLLAIDLSEVETSYRILSFMGVGAMALVIAFLYHRYRAVLERYL